MLSAASLHAQQTGDPEYRPEVANPMHATGEGPLVLIDSGHTNFHTKEGRYGPFARLIEADGYVVESGDGRFTPESISEASVLIIANAIHPDNMVDDWRLPILPAFTDEEVEAVVGYVESGGGLFLVVDHMPFPGAAASLAARFGIDLSNGFAFVTDGRNATLPGPTVFRRSEGRIGDHPVTRGRSATEKVNQVATFAGTAFPVTGDAVPILSFGEHALMLYPTVAWEFDERTGKAMIPGWSQGVALRHGRGRVVIFGEAAMFTSQAAGNGVVVGMTSKVSEDNQRLALNIVRWLACDLEE